MALELEYRGTFIDVQEDPFEVPSKPESPKP